MSFGPVTPADIDFSDATALMARDCESACLSPVAAWAQAQRVFLAGTQFEQRQHMKTDFTVLDTGFGLGHNFLAAWQAWRTATQRCRRLWYVAIVGRPPRQNDLQRAHTGSPLAGLSTELAAQWPPLTPDIHLLRFEGGQVNLLLALGDAAAVLPQLVMQADAIFLDGGAPGRNPQMWAPRVLKPLARLAAPQARLATRCASSELQHTLNSLGFEIESCPAPNGEAELTAARYAPRHQASMPPGRTALRPRQVAVVGAGLAGAAAAQALAARGVGVTVFEREHAVAQGASGNPGGLYHGIVHQADSLHARWYRACALHAHRVLQPLVSSGTVPGQAAGLLRLETRHRLETMQSMLKAQGLPPDYARAVGPDEAAQLCGWPLREAAWLLPQAGWARPASLVQHWLAQPGIELRTGHALSRSPPHGFDAVVLANGAALPGLAPTPLQVDRIRGQVSWTAAGALPPPLMPVSGAGYALALGQGQTLCGATSHRDLLPVQLAKADELDNLARLWQLAAPGHKPPSAAQGSRAGERISLPGRLPLVGPFAQSALPTGLRLDQPRLLPRMPGTYVLGALGSRGLTQAALCGELLAAWMCGTPWPVPAALADAVDPARLLLQR